MSAVEPPSSSAAAAPAPREFYHFDVTFYFSLISFLYDEGVPNRRGVDLSLVVTLYSVYVLVCFFLCFFLCFFFVFFTELQAYVCRDEERE